MVLTMTVGSTNRGIVARRHHGHGTFTLQVPVLHAGRVTLTAQMADGSTRSTGWSQSVAARRW